MILLIISAGDNADNIVRGCNSYVGSKDAYCKRAQKVADLIGAEVRCSTCETDLCNSTPNMKRESYNLMLAFIATVIYCT